MVNSSRLETHRSSAGGQKRWLTLVSSHPVQICPLGGERPSNITQPFDLSTPTRPFPCCDGWPFVQVSWFIELQIFTFFLPPFHSPSLCTHTFIFSYQLESCQKKSIVLYETEFQVDMIIMTEVLSLSHSLSLTLLSWGSFFTFLISMWQNVCLMASPGL